MAEEIKDIIENEITVEVDSEMIDENYIIIENEKNIEFFGTEKQRIEMFTDWALYFGEVTNPENTTKNTALGGAKYSPLNEVLNTVRPTLSKYGLAIIQSPPYMFDDKVCVKTIVTHKNGAIMSFPASESKLIRPNNAVSEIQALGLSTTYLRRFSINAVAGVQGEIDDDGNIGGKEDDKKPKTPAKKETSPLKNELIEVCKAKAPIDRDKVTSILSKYGNRDGLVANITNDEEIKKAIEELNEIKEKK